MKKRISIFLSFALVISVVGTSKGAAWAAEQTGQAEETAAMEEDSKKAQKQAQKKSDKAFVQMEENAEEVSAQVEGSSEGATAQVEGSTEEALIKAEENAEEAPMQESTEMIMETPDEPAEEAASDFSAEETDPGMIADDTEIDLTEWESEEELLGKDEILKLPKKIHGDFVIQGDVLMEYTGSDEHVVIPGDLGIKRVQGFEDNSTIRSVVIPEGVLVILPAAFARAVNLERVILPESLQGINAFGFNMCSNLKSINFPSGMTFIDDSSFAYCYSLPNITLPAALQSLGHGAFAECPLIDRIVLPQGLTYLGSSVFYGSKISELLLPDGLEYLGEFAFANTNIKEVTVPMHTYVNLASFLEIDSDIESNITVYGYEGSSAHAAALLNGTNFVSIGTMYNFEDQATGFKISGNARYFPDGSELSVVPVTAGAAYERAVNALEGLCDADSLVVYDICLMLDGEEYVLGEEQYIKIYFPLPENFSELEGYTYQIYHVMDDGTVENMNAVIEDGYAVYRSNHFSYYALAAVPADNQNSGDNQEETEKQTESEKETETEKQTDSVIGDESNNPKETKSGKTNRTDKTNGGSTQKSNVPSTGDGSDVTLWSMVLLAALFVISRRMVIRKTKN